jgi:LAS superfamily LD-carboxypeptidase LdcB
LHVSLFVQDPLIGDKVTSSQQQQQQQQQILLLLLQQLQQQQLQPQQQQQLQQQLLLQQQQPLDRNMFVVTSKMFMLTRVYIFHSMLTTQTSKQNVHNNKDERMGSS